MAVAAVASVPATVTFTGGSNSISVPVDNIIFSIGAFGGVLPWESVWEIFIVNLLVKYAVTLVSLPLIYIVPDSRIDE